MSDNSIPRRRVAVVTGSSSGIGFATSMALARNGFRTYATVRDLEKSVLLREAITKENLPLQIEKLDVSEQRSVKAAFRKILTQEEGNIDILINNAGYDLIGCVEEVSLGEIKTQFETNFFGVVRAIQVVLPTMRKNKSGIIVNVSSLSGREGWPAGSAYVSSKFALEGLSECLAYELQKFGIKVIMIEPGAVKSNIQRSTILAKKAERFSSPYLPLTQKVLDRLAFLQKDAIPSEDVAKVILGAITSESPNFRYPIGINSISIPARQLRLRTDFQYF